MTPGYAASARRAAFALAASPDRTSRPELEVGERKTLEFDAITTPTMDLRVAACPT